LRVAGTSMDQESDAFDVVENTETGEKSVHSKGIDVVHMIADTVVGTGSRTMAGLHIYSGGHRQMGLRTMAGSDMAVELNIAADSRTAGSVAHHMVVDAEPPVLHWVSVLLVWIVLVA
jgi:hypothetical protein